MGKLEHSQSKVVLHVERFERFLLKHKRYLHHGVLEIAIPKKMI